jgi:cytochrome c biogenesis protein CcmG/thiol:disulfide interchange protein DsbE
VNEREVRSAGEPVQEARPAADRPDRMLIAVVVTAIIVTLAAVLVGQPTLSGGDAGDTPAGQTPGLPPAVGTMAPDFSATTVDGEDVSLSALRGRPVWLTFGGSWCADCRAEAPDLQATYAKFRDHGLAVLGVFYAEDADAVADYARRAGLTFPLVADPSARIAGRYRVRANPTHYFIDAAGVIREVRLGGLEPAEMERLVAALLE